MDTGRAVKFKISILAVMIVTVAASVVHFINTTTTMTDENLFVPIKNRVYLKENIIIQDLSKNLYPDTIPGGSILVAAGKHKIEQIAGLNEHLYSNDSTEYFSIRYFHLRKLTSDSAILHRDLLSAANMIDIKSGAFVSYVYEGGTSDRAGLQVGDLIVKINDKDFPAPTEIIDMMNNARSGTVLKYQVLRLEQIFDIQVALAKYGVHFSHLIAFITGMLLLFLAGFIGIKQKMVKGAGLTAFSLIALGIIYTLGVYTSGWNQSVFESFRVVMTFLGVNIGVPLILHSFVYFPKENRRVSSNKKLIYGLYIYGIASFVFYIPNIFFFPEYWNENIFHVVAALPVFVFVAYDLINRKNYSKEYKRLRRFISLGYYINFAFFLILEISKFFKISFLLTSATEYVFLVSLIFPISYVYTIGRYRIFDIDIRVKRNIIYTFITLLWKAFVAAIFLVLVWYISVIDFDLPNIHFTGTAIEVIDRPLSPALEIIYEKVIIVIISIFLGIIFFKIAKKVQKTVDEKFYRVNFDYRKASDELSTMLEKRLELSELASGIVEKLGKLIKLKKVGVLIFKDEKKLCSQDYYGLKDQNIREFCMFAADEIITAINQFSGSFRVDYLDDKLKEIFRSCQFEYIVPIRSKGKLVGALLVGEKRSEASFHTQDLDFLLSIATQAAYAIENSFLYENLAQQERIKHELNIARRIQLASLPNDIPEIQGLDISGVSLPALEVGGDFYDFLNGKVGNLTIVVGDVSGKGTSAALYMSKAQGIMRTLHEFMPTPKDLFVKSNRLLYKYMEKSSFITAIGAEFDVSDMTISFSRAGHLPLYRFKRSTASVEILTPKGIVIGLTKDQMFSRNLEEVTMTYDEGDIFLFITDGVIEARSESKEEFGESRLINVFSYAARTAGESQAIRDSILNAVQDFARNTDQFDDLTVVVVKTG